MSIGNYSCIGCGHLVNSETGVAVGEGSGLFHGCDPLMHPISVVCMFLGGGDCAVER